MGYESYDGNCTTLPFSRLAVRISECTDVLREVNREEVYLDWDPSEYQLLGKMRTLSELFGSLWHVALEFHEKYERWYNGPLKGLDSADIQKQVPLTVDSNIGLQATRHDCHCPLTGLANVRKVDVAVPHLPRQPSICPTHRRDDQVQDREVPRALTSAAHDLQPRSEGTPLETHRVGKRDA